MLYIVLHGSEVVGVMTSPVDAALIAKPLQAQVWTCQPNSCDATLLQEPILPAVQQQPQPQQHGRHATAGSISRYS